MKKFLALILALLMVFSLAACGGGDTGESQKPSPNPSSNPPSAAQPGESEQPSVVPEAIPYTPINYWGFENADGLTAIHQVDKSENPALTGLGENGHALADSVHEIMIAEGQGAVGNALYLDGKYGVKLDMVAPSDDSYTISFWYNADRVATFGPVVQMGRNVGMAGTADIAVTWINFTKSTWGPAESPDIMPVVWNKNSSIVEENNWKDGLNPWVAPSTQYGKKEWCLCTIVVDGNRYKADDGADRIGTKLYVNGELAFDASPEFMFYQGIAPEIFLGDALFGIEAYVGINYWDTVFKGFVDELYVYDEALTAGMVKTLYEQGNPPATPVAPEYNGPLDGEGGDTPEPAEPIDPSTLGAAPVDSSAIDTLGNPDRTLPWWTDNTGSYAVVEGKTTTLKLNNYSCAANNWSNFALVLCANEFDTNAFASGDAAVCTVPDYVEYAVQRADMFGWGPEGYSATYEISWTDWVAWLNLMTDAEVSVAITRAGNVVTMDYTFTGADGTVMTEKAVVTTTAPADGPIYVFVEGEGAYIELLSVN